MVHSGVILSDEFEMIVFPVFEPFGLFIEKGERKSEIARFDTSIFNHFLSAWAQK